MLLCTRRGEIQYSKGHKYLTPIYQIDLGVTRPPVAAAIQSQPR
jgi:hypothetical protein